ncbi:MAG: sulfate permease [Verrucomicrobia bacterium]|nr:sulfate permease [Verrucomicrobiota bacterium]
MFWTQFIPKTWLAFKEHYTFAKFKKDLIAGITVGVVALPLAMAFGIASGVTPIRGLYTAIIAGFLISLLGGSFFQIGGPTGAFVIVIYAIVAQLGYNGLVISTLLAGLILLIAAFFRLGAVIKYIPYPLIIGFTTGIAFVIFFSQIKDFFGLQIDNLPIDFIPKTIAIFSAFHTWDPATFAVAFGTLSLIIFIRKYFPVVPWGISSIVVATAISWLFQLPVETIADRFGQIPSTLPTFALPDFSSSFAAWDKIVPAAFTIAFLAGIESLLSAIVADGMTGRRHKSNCELMAQGVANIGSVLFGGIPATGAIARTATNIKSGAQSPIAGMTHALTLLLIVLAFAPIVSQIPIASLSAVLIMVAWNMSELGHFRHLFKAPLGDVAVLLTTFFLTVVVDLIVAIEIGMILAAFLFMKRISDLSGVASLKTINEENKETIDPDAIEKKRVPAGVEVYEINGLFFFSLADTLKGVLSNIESPPKVFILRLRKVPTIDASGMHALREFHHKCAREGAKLILSGVNPTVHKALKKFGLVELIGPSQILPHIDPALERARELSTNGI